MAGFSSADGTIQANLELVQVDNRSPGLQLDGARESGDGWTGADVVTMRRAEADPDAVRRFDVENRLPIEVRSGLMRCRATLTLGVP